MVSRRPGESRRRALRRAADPGHDRQRLAGRPRSLPGGGHERPCGEADRQGAWCCLLGHLGRSGDGGAGNDDSGRGELVEARGDRRRVRRQPGLIVRCCGARFRIWDLFAQLERQLSEGDVGQSATCIPSRAARPPLAPAPRPTVPASWSRPCARRSAAQRKIAGIRLDELRTLCDACTCSACRRVRRRAGGVGELNPARWPVRQGFRRTRGSPASAAACRANNAMGVIRRYS